MLQFSGIKAVCECWGPFTSGLDIKNRWHDGLRVRTLDRIVEVQWRKQSLWTRIWKSGDMTWTFKTGILKYRRAQETVTKSICLGEDLMLQRNLDKVGNGYWGQILKCQDSKYGCFSVGSGVP